MSVSFFMWSSLLLCISAQVLMAFHAFWKKDRPILKERSICAKTGDILFFLWPTLLWVFGMAPLKSLCSFSIPSRMVFLHDEYVVAAFEESTSLWYWDELVEKLVDTDFHPYREMTIHITIPLKSEAPGVSGEITLSVLANTTLEDFLLYHRTFGHEPPMIIIQSIMETAAAQCVIHHSMSDSALAHFIRTQMIVMFEATLGDAGLHLKAIDVSIHGRGDETVHAPRVPGMWAEFQFRSTHSALG